ncbi:STAS domain-containing protein [Paenibacillus aurantius]|uniref:Anti-sigma factor antagonist n=1 Tax=Paenibacillus aurantius TaxID=2918900 RepID=A0AA96LED0_9BACL|nr:STAS domain-containing protein [Paenibacillus aurantius]WNQ10531.1 STAS domain-containing protein [Paenibacillus aurantius]
MNAEKKFYVTKEVAADTITVYLHGELDLSMAPEMRADLEPYVNQTGRGLILNLKDLKYIDSTGIGIIILILKQRDALGASFHVAEIPSKIQRLFDITGITQYLLPNSGKSSVERKEDII